MSDEIIIDPFDAKFEDIDIRIHNAKIETIPQITPNKKASALYEGWPVN